MESITVDYKGYIITTDKSLMKIDDVYRWLSELSYWTKGVPFDVFKKSFDNSYCIGTLTGDKQIAFARFITDYATFAYLADVYVEEPYRGQGISKAMMDILMNIDWVKQCRGIKLMTLDAHGLYRQYGFGPAKYPERLMEISRPDVYKAG